MDLQAVRQQIADLLEPVGLRCDSYVRDDPAPPCALVYPETIEYDAMYGTTTTAADALFVVLLIAGATDDRNAQKQLDDWLNVDSTNSVKKALEGTAELGGEADSLRAISVRNYGARPFFEGGPRYFSAELMVEVWV